MNTTGYHPTDSSSLTIGEDQFTQSLQTSKSLLHISVRGILIDRSIGSSGGHTLLSELGSVPDELLQRFIVVLQKQQPLGLLDNVTEIFQDGLAFGRELGVGVLQLVVVDER